MIYVPPHLVPDCWPRIEAGLRVAIEKSHNETSLDTVMALVESGKAILLLTPEGDGFAVVEPYKTDRGEWLNIIFAHCTKRQSVIEGYRYISDMARRAGALGVKMFSSRPGMARLARRLGMTPRFVEYVEEVR